MFSLQSSKCALIRPDFVRQVKVVHSARLVSIVGASRWRALHTSITLYLEGCQPKADLPSRPSRHAQHLMRNFQRYTYPLQIQGGLTSGRRPVVKIIAESISQHYEKHVVPTPLSGIRVGRRYLL
jgi:hypothetical protein